MKSRMYDLKCAILKNRGIASIFLFIFLFSPFLFASEVDSKRNSVIYKNNSFLNEAISLIEKHYLHDVVSKDLVYGALKGMFDSLDAFSEFLLPEQYTKMLTDVRGEFGGIGLVVSYRDNKLTVVVAIDGTPAAIAGVCCEDIIVEIDGVKTSELTFYDALSMMRGEPDSEVEILVERDGEKSFVKFKIKRTVIDLITVKDPLFLSNDIAYVRIVDFGEKTQDKFKTALSELHANGARNLIVDLRNNPGGLLESAVEVSDFLLDKNDLIVYAKDKVGKVQFEFKAKSKDDLDFKKIVILVNEASASGSEIVAASIQDNNRGLLIGTKTFGKASVQTVIPLIDGSAIRLTTAEYFTPSGKSIHNSGVVPDIEVEYFNEMIQKLEINSEQVRRDFLFNPDNRLEILLADSQVSRAIKEINKDRSSHS